MGSRVSPQLVTLVGGGSTFVAWAVDRLFPHLPNIVPLAILFVGVVMAGFGAVRWAQGARDKDEPGPREKADRLHNLVPMRDALAYWHFREWNRHFGGIDRLVEYGSAADRFEAYAGNGVLEIWGRAGDNPNTFASPIPADAWKEQLIDRMSAFTEIANTEYRNVEPSYQYRRFYDLAVNWKEVEELFPPKRFRTLRAWKNRLTNALTAY